MANRQNERWSVTEGGRKENEKQKNTEAFSPDRTSCLLASRRKRIERRATISNVSGVLAFLLHAVAGVNQPNKAGKHI